MDYIDGIIESNLKAFNYYHNLAKNNFDFENYTLGRVVCFDHESYDVFKLVIEKKEKFFNLFLENLLKADKEKYSISINLDSVFDMQPEFIEFFKNFLTREELSRINSGEVCKIDLSDNRATFAIKIYLDSHGGA